MGPPGFETTCKPGYVLVGPLSNVIGITATLAAAAAWAVVSTATVLAVPSVRGLRRRDGEAEPVEAFTGVLTTGSSPPATGPGE